jgi:hypothetical protein
VFPMDWRVVEVVCEVGSSVCREVGDFPGLSRMNCNLCTNFSTALSNAVKSVCLCRIL